MSSKLASLAEESGMSIEEFYKELRMDYATHISLVLDDLPDFVTHEHIANFGNHRVVIRSHKELLN